VKLFKLLTSINPRKITGLKTDSGGNDISEGPDITSIHYRSQDVKPGGLFVAIPGFAADGHDFIDAALQKGALAVVTQKAVKNQSIIIEVDNARQALAALSAQFYGHPSAHLFLIGVTGTNGKTTTAYLIENVLASAGYKVGVIGTINYRYAGKNFESSVTTPESLDLQRILAQMRQGGITHVVLEVSSHALDLYRVDKCWLDVGVFTNLTQDHLDYHKSMNAYWACKKKLFTENLSHGPKKDRTLAVINGDDPKGQELLNMLSIPCMSTGLAPDRMIWPQSVQSDQSGMQIRITTPVGAFDIASLLVGKHNLENMLCAAAVGMALKISPANIKSGLEQTTFVPGRLERIQNDNGYYIYVDYAHTPDALKNVLSALRAVTSEKIICIFGCGGDRDREKRPQMGEIAAKLCDLSIITSDNPRSEEPLVIIEEILQGTRKICRQEYTPKGLLNAYENKGFVVEPDRRKAIRLGITTARPGDTVLIAGKGHETYQIIGDEFLSFDDREEAAKVVSTINVQGLNESPSGNPKLATRNPQSVTPNPLSWTTANLLEATGADLVSGDIADTFTGIGIDSRNISAGELFVAIKGDLHDGHSFADDIIRRGVRGIVVGKDQIAVLPHEDWQKKGITCLAVDDTTRALGDLAAFHRKRTNVSVVAITGSNGKTTTREMMAAVVSRRFNTLSSSKNFNNKIGVPLTLFKLNSTHQWAVVELGMNAPGEIDRLAEICRPEIGVITNIGPVHLEGVGSIDGVMRAKGELLTRIRPDGTAVMNADDHRVVNLAGKTDRAVLFFGKSEKAQIRALRVKASGLGTSFSLALPQAQTGIDLKIPGAFMVWNALAAAAVGYQIGLFAEEIKSGLENFQPLQGRMTILETAKGIHIIDDTYNANPESMKAALATLKELKKDKRGVFVIGDMLELGDHAESLHHKIGVVAARSGITRLYSTGAFADTVAAGARSENMNPHNIFIGAKQEILDDLICCLKPDDWVLIKGSRGMRMEDIVEGLRQWAEG
jgi:murE/murF fusion protein